MGQDKTVFPGSIAQPVSSIRKQRCGNCQHFAPEEFREHPPECRKLLPTLVTGPGGSVGGAWTPTKPTRFCAQWEALKPDAYEDPAM